jgi:5-methylcytosine-specific restriction enzyme A
MTNRRRLTKLQQIRIFDREGGRCWICGRKIQTGEAWDLDHEKALAFGGPDDESNLKPLHRHCHQVKTAVEHRDWAKADRIRSKHLGIEGRGQKLPCGRQSKWKKKLDGSVVLR